ncbi:polyketide synthase docking domain-containing protein, partial [Nocardia sp. bgisy118]
MIGEEKYLDYLRRVSGDLHA